MADEFDELQELVLADMRKTYSETTIEHAVNPRNVGNIPDADGFGSVTGPCGDTMEIWLKVSNEKIAEATFWTDGCGTSAASGSIGTELIRGKNITEALELTTDDVLHALGGLPEESVHCALLVVNTLHEAIRDYLASKNEPWKRAYQRHGK